MSKDLKKGPPISRKHRALRVGLPSDLVVQRQQKYGGNQVEEEKKIHGLLIFLHQFHSPLILILLAATIASVFLKETTDALVIFLAVLVNIVLGFFQEFKAEKALQSLKDLIVPHCLVFRDNKKISIKTSELVPGDWVILKRGDSIPADGIVISSSNLHVSESILTGESMPVKKQALSKREIRNLINSLGRARSVNRIGRQSNRVFMGTNTVLGYAEILVVNIGKETRIGSMARKLAQVSNEKTPLKTQIAKLAKILSLVIGLVCLMIFVFGLARGLPLPEIFALSIALAVAAIPEGLAVSVTMVLALGMERIAKQKGLVRRLLAAETLGSVDIICLDKTGTLTEGNMRVVKTSLVNKKKAILAAIACNNLINPVDVALWSWVKAGVSINNNDSLNLKSDWPRQDEIPFSSKKKINAVLLKDAGDKGVIYLTGAPEIVISLSNLSPKDKNVWQQRLDKQTKKGLRAVGIAAKDGRIDGLKNIFTVLKRKSNFDEKSLKPSSKLAFLGLVFFEDPIRGDVKKSLSLAKKAGIEIKVITGDYQKTAIFVLRKLGIFSKRISGNQLMSGTEVKQISKQGLARAVKEVVLFYRTTPEQKNKIVSTLQESDHVVAMLGDGVNDALSLKKADIGIVVGEASDVSKGTADMVLLDSNFSTIVSTIREGRSIFENIKKIVLYLLSSSFSELILIAVSFIFNLPLPVLAAQILWVNLIEDSLPGLALAFEAGQEDLMKRKPRHKNSPILDKEIKTIIFAVSLVTDAILFGLYWFLLKTGYPLAQIRTIIFAALAFDSLLFVFSCKSLRKNIWQINVFSNMFLNVAVLIGFLLLALAVYSPAFNLILKTEPISFNIFVAVLLLGFIDIFGIEMVKLIFKKMDWFED